MPFTVVDHRLVWIQRFVVGDLWRQQLFRRQVRRWITDSFRHLHRNFRPQQEVDQLQRAFDVLRVGRNGQAVHPENSAFFGPNDLQWRTGLARHEGRAVPHHPHVDLPLHKRVARVIGVEGQHVRHQLLQLVIGGFDLFGVGSVARVAQLAQRHLEHFACVVGQQQPPLVLRLPQIGPGGDRGRLQRVAVDADGRCAPDIGNGIVVVGIERLVQQVRIQILEVAELAFVDLLQHAFLAHLGDEIGGGHHQIVRAVLIGLQLGVHAFVGFVGGVNHLDAGFFGELLQQPRRNVFSPVIEVQCLAVRGVCRAHAQRHHPGCEQM